MHELSLAENMINAALQAEGVTARNLLALNIKCGVLSGVNVESLKFCLQLICDQRNLGEIAANIAEIPAQLKCVCGCCYNSDNVFVECPECGSTEHQIVEGGDILLESVEVKDG